MNKNLNANVVNQNQEVHMGENIRAQENYNNNIISGNNINNTNNNNPNHVNNGKQINLNNNFPNYGNDNMNNMNNNINNMNNPLAIIIDQANVIKSLEKKVYELQKEIQYLKSRSHQEELSLSSGGFKMSSDKALVSGGNTSRDLNLNKSGTNSVKNLQSSSQYNNNNNEEQSNKYDRLLNENSLYNPKQFINFDSKTYDSYRVLEDTAFNNNFTNTNNVNGSNNFANMNMNNNNTNNTNNLFHYSASNQNLISNMNLNSMTNNNLNNNNINNNLNLNTNSNNYINTQSKMSNNNYSTSKNSTLTNNVNAQSQNNHQNKNNNHNNNINNHTNNQLNNMNTHVHMNQLNNTNNLMNNQINYINNMKMNLKNNCQNSQTSQSNQTNISNLPSYTLSNNFNSKSNISNNHINTNNSKTNLSGNVTSNIAISSVINSNNNMANNNLSKNDKKISDNKHKIEETSNMTNLKENKDEGENLRNILCAIDNTNASIIDFHVDDIKHLGGICGGMINNMKIDISNLNHHDLTTSLADQPSSRYMLNAPSQLHINFDPKIFDDIPRAELLKLNVILSLKNYRQITIEHYRCLLYNTLSLKNRNHLKKMIIYNFVLIKLNFFNNLSSVNIINNFNSLLIFFNNSYIKINNLVKMKHNKSDLNRNNDKNSSSGSLRTIKNKYDLSLLHDNEKSYQDKSEKSIHYKEQYKNDNISNYQYQQDLLLKQKQLLYENLKENEYNLKFDNLEIADIEGASGVQNNNNLTSKGYFTFSPKYQENQTNNLKNIKFDGVYDVNYNNYNNNDIIHNLQLSPYKTSRIDVIASPRSVNTSAATKLHKKNMSHGGLSSDFRKSYRIGVHSPNTPNKLHQRSENYRNIIFLHENS